jgi:hypothetical protein
MCGATCVKFILAKRQADPHPCFVSIPTVCPSPLEPGRKHHPGHHYQQPKHTIGQGKHPRRCRVEQQPLHPMLNKAPAVSPHLRRSHTSRVVKGQVTPSTASATTTAIAAKCASRNHQPFTQRHLARLPTTTSTKPLMTNRTTARCKTRMASASKP